MPNDKIFYTGDIVRIGGFDKSITDKLRTGSKSDLPKNYQFMVNYFPCVPLSANNPFASIEKEFILFDAPDDKEILSYGISKRGYDRNYMYIGSIPLNPGEMLRVKNLNGINYPYRSGFESYTILDILVDYEDEDLFTVIVPEDFVVHDNSTRCCDEELLREIMCTKVSAIFSSIRDKYIEVKDRFQFIFRTKNETSLESTLLLFPFESKTRLSECIETTVNEFLGHFISVNTIEINETSNLHNEEVYTEQLSRLSSKIEEIKIGAKVKCISNFENLNTKNKYGYIISVHNAVNSCEQIINTDNSVSDILIGVAFEEAITDNQEKEVGRVYKFNGKKITIVYLPTLWCRQVVGEQLELMEFEDKYNEEIFIEGKEVTLKSKEELLNIYGQNCFGELNCRVTFPKKKFNLCEKSFIIKSKTSNGNYITYLKDGDKGKLYIFEPQMFKEYKRITFATEDNNFKNLVIEFLSYENDNGEFQFKIPTLAWIDEDSFCNGNIIRFSNARTFKVIDSDDYTFTVCMDAGRNWDWDLTLPSYNSEKQFYKELYTGSNRYSIKQMVKPYLDLFNMEDIVPHLHKVGRKNRYMNFSMFNIEEIGTYRKAIYNYNSEVFGADIIASDSPVPETFYRNTFLGIISYNTYTKRMCSIHYGETAYPLVYFKIKKSAIGIENNLHLINPVIQD